MKLYADDIALAQAGAGHLNGWDFSDKEANQPPSNGPDGTSYINEKKE